MIEFLKLTRFSQPARDRVLYRSLQPQNVRRIVEIGVGSADRALHLISVVLRYTPASEIKYTGIDMFEGRTDVPRPTSLKAAHQKLVATGAAIRLLPGDAASALPRCANDLRGTDWVILSRDQDPSTIDRAWHFLPRMLHKDSTVWIESPAGNDFQVLTARDVSQQLATRSKRRRAA